MQTALHIYSLVRELKDYLGGAVLQRTEFYKKEREAYIHFKTGKGALALGLVYHPYSFGCFLMPRGKVEVHTTEKPWPFFQKAYGGRVTVVEQYDLDRIFRIKIAGETENFTIITEAIGPNGNFWFLSEDDMIIATLRHRKYDPAAPYRPPGAVDKLNPFDLDYQVLKEKFRESDQTVENVLRKIIIGLDRPMIYEIAHRAGVQPGAAVSDADETVLEKLAGGIRETAHNFEDYDRGYFYALPGSNLVYPFKLKTLAGECSKCKNLSFAVYAAIRSRKATKAEVVQRQDILEAVRRHAKKAARKAAKIEEDLRQAKNYEQYRKYAELLKIFFHMVKKGEEYAEVPDVYAGEGKGMIVIELDPALSPVQNAEMYFKKYRKAREGHDLIERRLEVAGKERNRARVMLEEFEQDYDAAAEKYAEELTEILPGTAERQAAVPRLPYKEQVLSTGVRVYVGRDGADNDATTFGHAKPYELWFHAAQCPGSHVVMKFPDKNFEPSKAEIHEAAAIAAYHSKAKNSKTVPVIYTPRKYVRKPRRAKPGLVTVEREKLVMVEPHKGE